MILIVLHDINGEKINMFCQAVFFLLRLSTVI